MLSLAISSLIKFIKITIVLYILKNWVHFWGTESQGTRNQKKCLHEIKSVGLNSAAMAFPHRISPACMSAWFLAVTILLQQKD